MIFRCRFSLTFLTWAVLLPAVIASAEAQDRPNLPVPGLDSVSVMDRDGNEIHRRGRVEKIEGDILTFREGLNSRIELFNMARVTSLSFSRGVLWDAGVTRIRTGKPNAAVSYLDQALEDEKRNWAWCEIQGTAVEALLLQGKRIEAISRIEQILARDARSRHVRLLPLVWDASLPKSDRVTATALDLKSESEVQRLVAASALLHDEIHRAVCVKVLERIQKRSDHRGLSVLAELQRWRLAVLSPDEAPALLVSRQQRLQQAPADLRWGAQYVMGSIQEHQHLYEDAALSFLWGPLTTTGDPSLMKRAEQRAVACLEKAGRPKQAKQLRGEFGF